MSSFSIENIESIDDKSYADIGIQVDLTSSHSFQNKSQHYVDLGYDSLHSTPKQYSDQKPHLRHYEISEDIDDISENSSIIISKWKEKFSKFRPKAAISKFLKNKKTIKHPKSDITNIEKLEKPVQTPVQSPVQPRLEWSKKIDFLLSIIGFAVDLANVWRFPYLCYKNGGGVFLIPYGIMLIFGALPLFFLELSAGQFTKSGPITMWNKLCPPMKGIGYCCVLISWYVSFYYNVIIAWTTYFIFKTLTSGPLMPWQHCNNEWNTEKCFSVSQMQQIECHKNFSDEIMYEEPNDTSLICNQINLTNRYSPAQEFFERGVLQIHKSSGLTDMGSLRPELIVCLAVVFCVLYFSLFKGVKSSGKVVWFTATAPYFILTILLIRGLFLDGAGEGIIYYISPRVEKLLEPSVWVDAAIQVFYSIGVGFGVHLTYASFNKFNNNCYRDCLITAAVNSLTSFYSGFVIFTYLGYLAKSMNKEIQNVANEGYGLVFQVYPEALSTLPFAKLWTLLFFIMLLTLGIDSAMGGLEAVITGIMDEFNIKRLKREHFTIIVIFSSFLGSLINCTQGGGYTMFWFDTYSAGISLLCSAMFEAMAITYFYGLDKFCDGIESMIGHKPNRYWVMSWKYISPCFLTCVIVMSVINSISQDLKYHDYLFPLWATILGWLFTLSSVSAIPIVAFIWWLNNRKQTQNLVVNSVVMHDISDTTTIITKNDIIQKSNISPIFV